MSIKNQVLTILKNHDDIYKGKYNINQSLMELINIYIKQFVRYKNKQNKLEIDTLLKTNQECNNLYNDLYENYNETLQTIDIKQKEAYDKSVKALNNADERCEKFIQKIKKDSDNLLDQKQSEYLNQIDYIRTQLDDCNNMIKQDKAEYNKAYLGMGKELDETRLKNKELIDKYDKLNDKFKSMESIEHAEYNTLIQDNNRYHKIVLEYRDTIKKYTDNIQKCKDTINDKNKAIISLQDKLSTKNKHLTNIIDKNKQDHTHQTNINNQLKDTIVKEGVCMSKIKEHYRLLQQLIEDETHIIDDESSYKSYIERISKIILSNKKLMENSIDLHKNIDSLTHELSACQSKK